MEEQTLAMSLYKERGKLIPNVKMTMMALLFVSSHRNGIFASPGINAANTCGIVSPMMMQNASMPPNALTTAISQAYLKFVAGVTTYKAHWATLIAISPLFPKQCSTVA